VVLGSQVSFFGVGDPLCAVCAPPIAHSRSLGHDHTTTSVGALVSCRFGFRGATAPGRVAAPPHNATPSWTTRGPNHNVPFAFTDHTQVSCPCHTSRFSVAPSCAQRALSSVFNFVCHRGFKAVTVEKSQVCAHLSEPPPILRTSRRAPACRASTAVSLSQVLCRWSRGAVCHGICQVRKCEDTSQG
jgi:hypothetical protein